ncbi:protein N-terminal glutamine amidohydrolase-like isoform X2 [Anneissia japonica]|uniref:protein N-terminal glutamine amidohydrolase-like isoform X2 n=1 Tax=Anneissia japonica TaxID=1529436 RepID=UPI001425AEA8|nr:protein N-terminal glutamine amidohydrolase-like isoform X2 [Anneissia japonica]
MTAYIQAVIVRRMSGSYVKSYEMKAGFSSFRMFLLYSFRMMQRKYHFGNKSVLMKDRLLSGFKYYLEMALRTEDHMKETYHRKFRVVSGAVFLDTFASDRKHMKGPDGLWLKPPPMYPCISTKASSNNLADFITMVPSVGVGDVINLNTLVHRFSS